MKFKAKDGEISELEIDGKAIPKEDFGKYRNFTENFLASLPMPPPPPSAPPSGGWNLPTPLTPPPSDWNVLPQPAPPVPPLYFKKTKDA